MSTLPAFDKAPDPRDDVLMRVWRDITAFEAWARSHGGLSLKAAPLDNQRMFQTYECYNTEIAWRAWANKPRATTLPPITNPHIRTIAICDGGGYQDDKTAEWTFSDEALMKFARALRGEQ